MAEEEEAPMTPPIPTDPEAISEMLGDPAKWFENCERQRGNSAE